MSRTPFVQTVTSAWRGSVASPVIWLPKRMMPPVVLMLLRTVSVPPSMKSVVSEPGASHMRMLFQTFRLPPCTSTRGAVRSGMNLPCASFCGEVFV